MARRVHVDVHLLPRLHANVLVARTRPLEVRLLVTALITVLRIHPRPIMTQRRHRIVRHQGRAQGNRRLNGQPVQPVWTTITR